MRVTTFEVEVEIRSTPYEYYSRYAQFISHRVIKMLHFERRTAQQAIQEASRFGRVISCSKVNADDALKAIEAMELQQAPIYEAGNPYQSAIAMDSMIWQKRNKRRENSYKDKDGA